MNISNNNLSKSLYKIFLIWVKYTPMFLSIVQTLIIALNYQGISCTSIYYLGGLSIPFIIMLFIMSYVFKFCYLYRIPLWYLTVITSINFIDNLFVFPLSTLNLFRFYALLFGIFIITFVWYMYKNRHKPKVDYIKQLCERYVYCCK